MTRGDVKRPRGGLADKRRAILAGALVRFARDGYVRAGMDAIAAEAGVSTRTIYNHFRGKAELFAAVIEDSAAGVADAEIALVDRHLGKIVDLPGDLFEFGVARSRPLTGFADHFALVRQINAEVEHIPSEAIEAWQRLGPLRVREAVADRLRQWVDRGLIHTEDPERSALHLMLLVSVQNPSMPWEHPSEEDLAASVTAGVRTFLHGHAPSTA
ncbi:TetR/AcrR family transcriptional regulator [Pseudonocardia parietis]|uniref:AcrR family transcriptional regulator n=1 Tax=Pseudonocardia parietis TaxID=570936 RepID=A0ABS4VSX6_9PSEU|nr:TetR/AcrR family transcriptional regulator [Pseudonocardia parietis]MBP2367033.1 AcrR family transcriptional regulator [Pseudonocardia parietis]